MPDATRPRLESSRRPIVVKVGTTTLCGDGPGPRADRLRAITAQLARAHRAGRPVLLVTSGAIATGAGALGLPRPASMPERQALAAVGQPVLMREYARHFARAGIAVAQVLLTADDLAVRRRYLNARNTVAALLRRHILPIVNENDTVATEEIRIGDNDTLSAQVAILVGAELLCILSDVDGLYTGDPRRDPAARRIPEVPAITAEIERLARRTPSGVGTGGMITKLTAARLATAAGCTVVIADGRTPRVLDRLLAGERLGTWFLPVARTVAGRKRWLVASARVRGRLVVDDGAAAALRERGRSLLPSGIREVHGAFSAGDLVAVLDPAGREIARGIVAHDRTVLEQMRGRRSQEIAHLARGRIEAIHRDNLVLSG
ncbi:MAG: glutamate 5-kinase [Armatimonadota bacterium]|nr:glutamate 5-kinase [Armatimonadota bacterium]MDR7533369.1 glutamate 5-kinase [Armatimonadota bacterium]MDR7536489.1 glutamate 5-kinase [Armatimonadota bacterium]